MKSRLLLAALLVMAVIIYPLIYTILLNTLVPRPVLRLQPEWEDNMLQTTYKDPGWLDSNFTDGWRVAWTLGQNNEDSGFEADGSVGDLYVTFTGTLCGIQINKSTGGIDSNIYRYLVITHWESSSDASLMFSFGLTDDKNVWHDGGWHHTSTSSTTLEIDLRKVYNGTIKSVSLRLTNDFDPTFEGGKHHAYVQSVGFFKTSPLWRLAYNDISVNCSITDNNGILKVAGNGIICKGTIVTAQRLTGLKIDLNTFDYLKVSVKTSGSNLAARILVWTDSSRSHTVLLKVYADADWHQEIIDLSYFGITGFRLHMIELGWIHISEIESMSNYAYYSQLSFNKLNANSVG